MITTRILLGLALTSFLIPSFARASTEDPADPSSANLVNLNYYLRPGKFRANLAGQWSLHDTTGATATTLGAYGLTVDYGLPVEGLRVMVSDSYETTTSQNHASTSKAEGFTDPFLYLNYRFLDAPGDGLSIDGEVFYSPNLDMDEIASSSETGNQLRGYPELGASVGAFWRSGIDEAELSAAMTEHFGRTATFLSDQITLSGTAYATGNISLADRIHVMPCFFVQPNLELVLASNHGYTYSDGAMISYSFPVYVIPEVVFGYLATPQLLFTAYVNGSWYSYTQTATFNVTSPVASDSSTLGVHVIYEF